MAVTRLSAAPDVVPFGLGRLFLAPADLDQLHGASRISFLVGGYDGHQNYGDVLQLRSACRRAAELAALPLAVLPVEFYEPAGAFLAPLAGDLSLRPIALWWAPDDVTPPPVLVEVPFPPDATALLHAYGGGYFTADWGPTKLALVRAVERWHRDGSSGVELPIFASGQQVTPWILGEGAAGARQLFASAQVVATRDRASWDLIARVCDDSGAARLREGCADDAIFEIIDGLGRAGGTVDADPAVMRLNLHLSAAPYSGLLEADVERTVADVVKATLQATSTAEVRLINAYRSVHIDETRWCELASRALGDRGICTRTIIACDDPDGFFDAVLSADVAIVVSYHVALTHALAGVPTFLLGRGPYYNQKYAGLQQQFGPAGVLRRAEPADGPGALANALCEALRDVRMRTRNGRGTIALVAAAVAEARRVDSAVRRAMDRALRVPHPSTEAALPEIATLEAALLALSPGPPDTQEAVERARVALADLGAVLRETREDAALSERQAASAGAMVARFLPQHRAAVARQEHVREGLRRLMGELGAVTVAAGAAAEDDSIELINRACEEVLRLAQEVARLTIEVRMARAQITAYQQNRTVAALVRLQRAFDSIVARLRRGTHAAP